MKSEGRLEIDGSQGEGGGQIVRSCLALALVTGKSVAIKNIRAGRKRPGLLQQHLTALKAAAQICGGETEGAKLGSQSVEFRPLPVRPGNYRFSVGTAGSATLVLQTVLPALLIAAGPSELSLEGGTHNPWAPPFDFLQRAFLPLIERMGPRVTATLHRHGFYPAGGGTFSVQIEPSPMLAGFDLLERGSARSHTAKAVVANLPQRIAAREIDVILRKLDWPASSGRSEQVEAHGPGNAVFAQLDYEDVSEVFTGFGRIGIRAEHVAQEVVKQVREYLQTSAPVGPYLADQLLLPLGISAWQPDPVGAHRGGSFCTGPLTGHSLTHANILRQFLEIDIRIEPLDDKGAVRVVISPGNS